MNIISHRGAAGLATENSIESIMLGANLGVNYVEFDVQKTSDNELVVIHNTTIHGSKKISACTLANVKAELPNIATVGDALKICQPSPALVEIKSDANTADLLLPYIKKYPRSAITSFYIKQIQTIKSKSKNTKCFLMQRKHPFGLIKKAKICNANGIGVNKNWLLILPFIYKKAKNHNLELFIYTVNSKWIAKTINRFLPAAIICTDNPPKISSNET